MELNSTEEILEDLRQGKMVIIMDDEDRENEGDLVMAAESETAGRRVRRPGGTDPLDHRAIDAAKARPPFEKNEVNPAGFRILAEVACATLTHVESSDLRGTP